MSFIVKISNKNNGISLPGLSKDKADEIVKLLSGLQCITRIAVEWDHNTPTQEPLLEYHRKECAEVSHPIASIEEVIPVKKKRGRPKKQPVIEPKDEDADYRNLLNQDTRTGYDGGKVEGDLSQ